MPYADPEYRRAYDRMRRASGPQREKKIAYMREYYQKNRDRRLERAKVDWQNRDREHQKNLRRKHRYGITADQFNEMLDRQGGLCALCREKPPVDVDHCHDTKKVRGLLCRSCNVGLGQLGDTVDGLVRAIAYLERKGD